MSKQSSWEDSIQEIDESSQSPIDSTKSPSWEDTIQEEQEPKQFSQAEALKLGVMSGAIPFDEQLVSAYDALTNPDDKKSFIDNYYEKQKIYKQDKDLASEQHPGTYYGSAATAGIASALIPGVALTKLAKAAEKTGKASKLLDTAKKLKLDKAAEYVTKNPIKSTTVSGALSGASSGDSEVLKGDVSSLPIDTGIGAVTGMLTPIAITEGAKLGKKIVPAIEGLGGFINKNMISDKYIKAPYRYAKKVGETVLGADVTNEGKAIPENIELNSMFGEYGDIASDLINKTSQFRKEADIKGLSSDITESLGKVNPEILSPQGRDLLLRARGEDPTIYSARQNLLKKFQEQALLGKESPDLSFTDVKGTPFSGAVGSSEELGKAYAKLGKNQIGKLYDPSKMSATEIHDLKTALYNLPADDRKQITDLLAEVKNQERKMAGEISSDYSDLVNKQHSSLEAGKLTGWQYKDIQGSTPEARLASARDNARAAFQKHGSIPEQLGEELKNIDPKLYQRYEGLKLHRQADDTRKGLSNLGVGGGLAMRAVTGTAGLVGKVANKIDTSDHGLFKSIRKLRSVGGKSSELASQLADKIEEATKADPTTRARLMFGIMQQPAYQQLLKEDEKDIKELIGTEE